MTVNTKRHIGDDVWFYNDHKIHRGKIFKIDITIEEAHYGHPAPWEVYERYQVHTYHNKEITNNDYSLHHMEIYNNMQEILQMVADKYEGG